jgi:HAMP domain-containing protein
MNSWRPTSVVGAELRSTDDPLSDSVTFWNPLVYPTYRAVSGPTWYVSNVSAPSRLALVLAVAWPAALMIAGVGGYWLARRALAPVDHMARHARRITADELHQRLPVDTPHDEFGRLATVFNETLTRLDDAFARLKRFTADASHELRTPLTAMRSVGEVALREHRNEAAYRDVIGSMLEEVDRLTIASTKRGRASTAEPASAWRSRSGRLRPTADALNCVREKAQEARFESSFHVSLDDASRGRSSRLLRSQALARGSHPVGG